MKRIAIFCKAMLMCITTVNASETLNKEATVFNTDSKNAFNISTIPSRRKKITHGIREKYSKYHNKKHQDDTVSEEMYTIKNAFLIQNEYQKTIGQYQTATLPSKHSFFKSIISGYIKQYNNLCSSNCYSPQIKTYN